MKSLFLTQKKWLLLSLSLLLACSLFAQYEEFQTANAAYENKQYPKAIAGYTALLEAGYQSAELHYNLANAYYRTGELGQAVLHYERALRLAPNDKDIVHNLEVVRRQVEAERPAIEGFRLWTNTLRLFSSDGWGALGLFILWLGVAGLVLWQIGKTREYRKWGFLAGVVLLFLSLLPFALAYFRSEADTNHNQAIVLQSQVMLRSAPDEQSQEVKPVFEGAKVQLLDVIGNWHKVQASDGEEGWLPDGTFERI